MDTATPVRHVLHDYQDGLVELEKGKRRLEEAKITKNDVYPVPGRPSSDWDVGVLEDMTNCCTDYFRELIPGELQLDIQVVPGSSPNMKELVIKVDGKIAAYGYISATPDVSALMESMVQKHPYGDQKTFALISWKTVSSDKCEFFEIGKDVERISAEALDYEWDREAIRVSLHHCIGFSVGIKEQYG